MFHFQRFHHELHLHRDMDIKVGCQEETSLSKVPIVLSSSPKRNTDGHISYSLEHVPNTIHVHLPHAPTLTMKPPGMRLGLTQECAEHKVDVKLTIGAHRCPGVRQLIVHV